MRVLLVEDDGDLSKRIAANLRAENFVVDIAQNGEDAEHAGLTELYDVAILDLGLPRIDGVSVLKSWRAAQRNLPVLVLTARDGWPDKVASFKAGADDFLTKPFKVEELVLRLRALVRRATGHAASIVTCGSLVFDAQLGTFEQNGLPLKLTGLNGACSPASSCARRWWLTAVNSSNGFMKAMRRWIQLHRSHHCPSAAQDRRRAYRDRSGPRLYVEGRAMSEPKINHGPSISRRLTVFQ